MRLSCADSVKPTERENVGELVRKSTADIEHVACDDTHELALRLSDLVVQAAQHAAPRTRVVVLHEVRIDACRAHGACVPALEEIARDRR